MEMRLLSLDQDFFLLGALRLVTRLRREISRKKYPLEPRVAKLWSESNVILEKKKLFVSLNRWNEKKNNSMVISLRRHLEESVQ